MILSGRSLRARLLAPAFGLMFLGLGTQLRALTIVLTFDSSVTNLPNAAAYEAATTYAAQQLENTFSDNITINITVMAVSGTSVFGESAFGLVGSTYSQVRSALTTHANTTQSANALASLADLPATDPTGGGTFFVNNAEAKVLGLIGPSSSSDGTFWFGAGYNFALTSPYHPTSTQFDFVGVAMHEMTEIMGRASGLGADFGNGQADFIPYDLFRYHASGVRDFTTSNVDYFSIDNGATNLKTYNSLNDGSDPQDWAPGTNDCCNNEEVEGTVNPLSAVDITTMNVIGYTPAGAAPAFTDGPATATATVGTPYTFSYTASPTGTFAVATGSLPPGLALTTGGVLSGTPTQAGTYSGTVSVTSGSNSTSQSFTITVASSGQPVAFSTWQSTYFTTAQLNIAAYSGPAATPQGDDVPNLIKYIANIDPTQTMSAADRAALPIVTFNKAGTTMTLTFREYAQLTGYTVTAQKSSDLVNWSTAGTPTTTGTDSVTHDPLMTLQTSVSGSAQYFRIRVTSP